MNEIILSTCALRVVCQIYITTKLFEKISYTNNFKSNDKFNHFKLNVIFKIPKVEFFTNDELIK